MRPLFRATAIALMVITSILVLGGLAALPCEAQASTTTGRLYYNTDNVMVVHVDTFTQTNTSLETSTITFKAADVVKQEVNTSSKPYIAVIADGSTSTLTEVTNEKAALVSVTGKSSSNSDCSVSGKAVLPSELSNVYTSTGIVGGRVSAEAQRKMFESITDFDDEDITAEIVDMPELNTASARLWALSIEDDIPMFVHAPATYPKAKFIGELSNTAEYVDGYVVTETEKDGTVKQYGMYATIDAAIDGALKLGATGISRNSLSTSASNGNKYKVSSSDELSPMSRIDDLGKTIDMSFDFQSYAGYFPDYRPLSDNVNKKEFSSFKFYGSWMVDGDGFLWFVSQDGTQLCYEQSFYTVAEGAFNSSSSSKLSIQSSLMAQSLSTQGVSMRFSPNIAFNFRGVSVTAYVSYGFDDIALDLLGHKLSFTEAHSFKLVASYGSSSSMSMTKNKCLNPKTPFVLELGPITLHTYLSLNASLDLAKMSFSYEKAHAVKYELDLGNGQLTSNILNDSHAGPDITGGFSATFKVFVTGNFLAGPVSIASMDINFGVKATFQHIVSSLEASGDLSIDAFLSVQLPSTYDKVLKIGDPVPISPTEPRIFSGLMQLPGIRDGVRLEFELWKKNLFNAHIGGSGDDIITSPIMLNTSMISFTSDVSNLIYSGFEHKPKVQVKTASGDILIEGIHYSLSYSNNTEAGIANVDINGLNNVHGNASKPFEIKKLVLSKETVDTNIPAVIYNGYAQQPSLVSINGPNLIRGTHYTVKSKNNVDAGLATSTITGTGSCSGSLTIRFKILPRDINSVKMCLSTTEVEYGQTKPITWMTDGTYDGTQLKTTPADEIEWDEIDTRTLGHRKHTATVKKSSKNYYGTKILYYTVKPRNLATSNIVDQYDAFHTVAAYNAGKSVASHISFYRKSHDDPDSWLPSTKDVFNRLNIGSDIKVKWGDTSNAGVHKATITGKGNYTGSKTVKYTIHKVDVQLLFGLAGGLGYRIPDYTYTGKPITPIGAIPIKHVYYNVKPSDYSVSYKNNVNAGTATAIIKGTSKNCEGQITRTFKILKAKNNMSAKGKTSSVKASKVKSKTISIKNAFSVSSSKGKVTYSKVSGAGNLSVDKNTGTVKIKKKTKKGSYKIKVTISDDGGKNYEAASKTVTSTIKVS